jgi:hypothetical protein
MEKIKINSVNLTKNLFIITDTNGKTFTGNILKGSVDFRIYNEDNQEVNLSNIEEGDVIKIQTTNIKSSDLKEQKNNIIKKIIIKNKYVFNSESSDDFKSDDENYFK